MATPVSLEESLRIFRQTGNPRYLPAVVQAILRHYVSEDVQPRLQTAGAELRLAEDLGIDSLTMMEIALATEDAFGFPVNVEELRQLMTVGEMERMLAVKAQAQ
ncbi:MAG TPA: phosphopantetheine-binding protein [Opitutaceae bacterium]|jgi:acyl carrier protein